MVLTLTIVLIIVILLAGLASAFAGGFYYLSKHPPTVRAEVFYPAPEVDKRYAKPAPKLDPIPQEILDYIDLESEDHARRGRRARVIALYNELGTWPTAFATLQREDST